MCTCLWSVMRPFLVPRHGPILGQKWRIEQEDWDYSQQSPRPPPQWMRQVKSYEINSERWFFLCSPTPTCKGPQYEQFTKKVWISTSWVETISDKIFPYFENEVFLGICCVMEPNTKDEHDQDHTKKARTGVILSSTNCQEDDIDPESKSKSNKQEDSGS